MASGLEEAERRVGYYRRVRDQAEIDLKRAQSALSAATAALDIAQRALDAAEDVHAAAARGIAKAPRQMKTETRALLLGLFGLKLDIVGMSEITAQAADMGFNLKADALRQWLKRVADDGFLERVDRGTYRLNRDMTAALADGAQRVNRPPLGLPAGPDAVIEDSGKDSVDPHHEQDSEALGEGEGVAGYDEPGAGPEGQGIRNIEEADTFGNLNEGDASRASTTRNTNHDHDYLDVDPPF